MAPVELPDPSMHTIYIVDPREMFIRYTAALTPTARLREGAQAGFLVLARLFYLAFGAVPRLLRHALPVLALVAIVPAYVLVRAPLRHPGRCCRDRRAVSAPRRHHRLGNRLPRLGSRLLRRRRRRLPGDAVP